MCGRFSLATPIDDIAADYDSEPLSDLTPFSPSWNITPQSLIPIMTEHGVDGEAQVPRHIRLMRWGFRPSWGKPSNREPINARAETVREKPMFRAAFERRRGVVPADGWYEWMTTPQGKVPWYHYRMDRHVALLAVIWDRWSNHEEHLETCALLTRAANRDCEDVHDRMPVILSKEEIDAWLSEGMLPSETPIGSIDRHPVSREVNKPSSNHSGLVKPLPSLFDQEYGV